MNARYLQEFVFTYDDTWLFKNKFIKYFEGGQRTKIKVSFQAKKKKKKCGWIWKSFLHTL